MRSDRDQSIARLAVLADRLRRRMYRVVRERRTPASREEVAAAVGVSRKLAAFHLDRLVGAGLLQAHYARRSGRGGPGAGRSSKLYEPSDVELDVTLPERRYDVAAHILLDALQTRQPDESAAAAAERVAGATGAEIGASRREQLAGRRGDMRSELAMARKLLRDHGFEPYSEAGAVRLRNCPFRRLAERSPDLVCAMNLAFVDGLLRGLGTETLAAVLAPRPGECCAVLTPAISRRVDDDVVAQRRKRGSERRLEERSTERGNDG